MKNLSGAPLLRVLPNAHRPASKLPFAPGEPGRGGPGEATARSLARRLALALHDLGLGLGLVPAGWVGVEGSVLVFGDLDVPAADHLVRHLEDLAAEVADSLAAVAAARRTPGAAQVTLFGADR